jgi:alanyl-tRNA synthetase
VSERLYYHDSYLTAFHARVAGSSADGLRVTLDRTAFYPTSGGQPFDTGRLNGATVVEVIDEGDGIAHVLSEPLLAGEVAGEIDWTRRFDHMQQHTGQHLLSAVLLHTLNAPTVGFHLGAESSSIDITCAPLDSAQVREIERRANAIVFENRPVIVSFQDASEDLGLRKPTERTGTVRIIAIDGLDRSACGGTHVRATGEIGAILIRKLDRIRGNVRIEFLCGGRALKRARADYETLASVAQLFSAPLEDSPALAAAQFEKLQESDRARRKLTSELAAAHGRERYARTEPDAGGVRRALVRAPALSDELRSEAQSFTAGEKAILLVLADAPPSALLAASKDSGMHAGERLKAALIKHGGRGGGAATLAQGSLPRPGVFGQIAAELGFGGLE